MLVALEVAEHVSGASVVVTLDDVLLSLVSMAVTAGSRRVIVTIYRNNGTVLLSREFQPGAVLSVALASVNRKITTRLVEMSLGVVETKYDWPHRVECL